jgi:hypothetical protein
LFAKEVNKTIQSKDEEGNQIFNERIRMGIPDGVNTLIYTIIRHFIETPSNITSRIIFMIN